MRSIRFTSCFVESLNYFPYFFLHWLLLQFVLFIFYIRTSSRFLVLLPILFLTNSFAVRLTVTNIAHIENLAQLYSTFVVRNSLFRSPLTVFILLHRNKPALNYIFLLMKFWYSLTLLHMLFIIGLSNTILTIFALINCLLILLLLMLLPIATMVFVLLHLWWFISNRFRLLMLKIFRIIVVSVAKILTLFSIGIIVGFGLSFSPV